VYGDVVSPLKLWDVAHFEGVLKTTEVQPMVYFAVVAQTLRVFWNGVYRAKHTPLEALLIVGVLHIDDPLAP